MHTSYVCRSIIFPYVYTHLVITHIMRMRIFLTGQKGIQSGILFLPDQFCLQEMAAPFFPALSLSQFSAFPPACRLHLQSPSIRHHFGHHPGSQPGPRDHLLCLLLTSAASFLISLPARPLPLPHYAPLLTTLPCLPIPS